MRQVWSAFHQLSTTRSFGFGVGPIPWSAIEHYASRHGITDEDEFATFCYLINQLDSAYMEHTEKTQKAKAAERQNKGPKARMPK